MINWPVTKSAELMLITRQYAANFRFSNKISTDVMDSESQRKVQEQCQGYAVLEGEGDFQPIKE